jgi:hypothetical protein
MTKKPKSRKAPAPKAPAPKPAAPMPYDRNVFVTQFPLVKYFIYHLTYYRILFDGYEEHQLQNEFWTLTIDAHLLRATTNWCMVFGSKSEPTHWRRLTEESESHAQNFRNGLFSEIGLSEVGWRKYWTDMKQFRDKWVAHRELKPFTDPVPNFDTALAVAYYYDNWVRDVISPHSLDEPPFELFAASLRESVTPLVNKLLRATEMGSAEPPA